MADFEEILDSFLNPTESYQDITVQRIIIVMLITFAMAMFIFFIYKNTFKGVIYNKNFNIGLVLLSMITAMVIIPISSNVSLSLGMVGALSIVRFRAALKDPNDIIFVFWSIAVGLTCGASLYIVAIVGTLIIGAVSYTLSKMDSIADEPYLLVINFDSRAEKKVNYALPTKHKLRSRTVTSSGIELMVELSMRKSDSNTVDNFLSIPGVENAALISYDGDYSS